MSLRGVLLRAGLVALVLAYTFAVSLGPREGLGVLLAAALAGVNLQLLGRRVHGDARLLSLPGAPDLRLLSAQSMITGIFRWLLTFFLVVGLLKWFHALAVVAGLSCVVASITLQAIIEYLRAERDPSAGAGP